jgi:hypothetical protein
MSIGYLMRSPRVYSVLSNHIEVLLCESDLVSIHRSTPV